MLVSCQLICLIGFTNLSLNNCTLRDGGGNNVPDENIAPLKAIGTTTTVICTECYVFNISADVSHIFYPPTYGWIRLTFQADYRYFE